MCGWLWLEGRGQGKGGLDWVWRSSESCVWRLGGMMGRGRKREIGELGNFFSCFSFFVRDLDG